MPSAIMLQPRNAHRQPAGDATTGLRLKDRLAAEEVRLRAAHAAGVGGFSTTQGRADAIADVVRDAFAASTLPVKGVVVAAIGGFGRREMFPHSDADLLILHEQPKEELHAGVKRSLESFYYLLLDAGITPDPRVFFPEDALEAADVCAKTRTSLLDMRFLAGDHLLHRQVESCVRSLWSDSPAGRATQLLHEGNDRNRRHGFAGTEPEPNLKLASGGLRDYHTLLWVARAHDPDLDDGLDSLQDGGLLTPAQRGSARRAADFLLRVRTSLHLGSRTANDVLSTADRGRMAALFEGSGVHAATLLPGESFSSGLTWHTRALMRASLAACCITCRDEDFMEPDSLFPTTDEDDDFFFTDEEFEDDEDDIPF